MKHFFKIFLIALGLFILMLVAGLVVYYNVLEETPEAIDQKINDENTVRTTGTEESKESSMDLDAFGRAIMESKRINMLLLGIEQTSRTDSMVLISFDAKTKNMDLVSIPRDTYYHVKNEDRMVQKQLDQRGQRKLNACFQRSMKSGLDQASQDTKETIEAFLDIPIHHYVTVSYGGVENIVNAIGGVEVRVPFHMTYEDLTPGYPPLIIDIPKGVQVLNGEAAVNFLRWRQNNDNTRSYPDGDLGRLKAQQKFMYSALEKGLTHNPVAMIQEVFSAIETDMTFKAATEYAKNLIGFNMANMSMHILPGANKEIDIGEELEVYYIADEEETKELMKAIYGVVASEDQ